MESYSLLSEVYNQLEGVSVPIEYTLTAGAKREFEQYHLNMFKRFKESSESDQSKLDAFIKRWSPSVLKLAIPSQYMIDSEARQIDEQAILAGISLCAYAEQCTRYLMKRELGESDFQSKARRVIDYIAKKGGKCLRQKLMASHVLDGGKSEYDYILESLEGSGRIFLERHEGKLSARSRIILTDSQSEG